VPEGPECAVVADVIRRGVGKSFVKAEVVENVAGKLHRYSKEPIPYWNRLQQPWVLAAVETHGKLIELQIKTSEQVLYGFSTLGMSGSWGWGFREHKHTRLNLVTQDDQNLSFVDMRCYGTFRLSPEIHAEKIRSKIGWDLLKAPAPDKMWAEFQFLRRLQYKPIALALLEQNTFSGIGNIYRAEVLYRLGIDPHTEIGALDTEVWASVNTETHQILKVAYKKGGSSVDTFEADGKEGTAHFDHKIYGKAMCPKGHPVSRTVMKKRTMHWCKFCQKL
jgi:DNA-formamidopyrimidine glycosylase